MNQHPNPDLYGERASSRQSSNHIWVWSLRPWWRAVLFLIPILAAGLGLSWEAFRAAWSSYAIDAVAIKDVQKALNRDPGNSDLIHRLGMLYTTDPTESNLTEAVKNLRRATELNPHRWDYWSDLGTSCDFAGNTTCSDEAFDRAWMLNPMTPALEWALGNHYLLTDRPEKSFPYFRRLIVLDPEYLDNTYRLCLRAIRDPQTIYREVVPHEKDLSPRIAFLMLLTTTADYESAMKIWGQMISGPDRSPNLSLVKPFLDFLIDHDQIQDAGTVWTDLQHSGVIPAAPAGQSANLLYNGDFEGEPLNTGFDWRISDSQDLEYDFSDPSAHQGAKCLRIEFPIGRNADYDLLDQVVRIKPNTRYQLTAYVRSENLTSNSGPRLRAIELGCENCPPRTSAPTVGTTPWHPIDVEFLTQPQTQAVRISFWRPQDLVSSRDITGKVWLDDVTLHGLDASVPHVNQERTR
jgi:tetratricopeptide (TPR) repeat protein